MFNINLLIQFTPNFLKFTFKEVVENLGWVSRSPSNAVLGAQAGLFAVQHGSTLRVRTQESMIKKTCFHTTIEPARPARTCCAIAN